MPRPRARPACPVRSSTPCATARSFPLWRADEAAVVHYGREFFRTHRVSRGAFQAALEQFGRQGVVELGLIMGNYSLLALLINSFDTDLPPDRTEPLLPV